jgi:hypothetical protein
MCDGLSHNEPGDVFLRRGKPPWIQRPGQLGHSDNTKATAQRFSSTTELTGQRTIRNRLELSKTVPTVQSPETWPLWFNDWYALQYIHASSTANTSFSRASGALPIRLARRARKSVDFT